MNIKKDGKTLYFSDEEIDNETNGEKKVFVTKRINGEESHTKVEKNKKENKKKANTFDFNNEVVIGVNMPKNEEKIEKKNHKKSKKKKNSHYKEKERKKRKKKSYKKLIAVFSSMVLIAIVIVIALITPIFNITDIQIEGNEKISENTIYTLSGIKKGENIFRFNNSVIDNIKENKYIERVKITRRLPGTVIITVEERNIKYQVNLVNGYTYIDKNGYILENSTVKKEIPVLVGLSITEEELLKKDKLKLEDLEKLNKIHRIMESAKANEIDTIVTEINVEDEEDYVLYIESKNKKVHIGNTSNLTNKMLYIKKILENEEGKTGIIFVNGDISAGFKPYFREE